MKTNYWLVLATMVATSAVAQVDTNNLPAIPAPATAAAPVTPAAVAAPEAASAAEPAPTPTPAKKKAAPKKHEKHAVKKIYEPTVNLVPGPATVVAEHLNLRGQAGMKGEAIGHLKVGDTVTVVAQINLDKHAADEPAQWAKIILPSDVKVWVSAHFIDAATKTVTARKLNLRAGPGENFSTLGILDKGATINVLSTKGTWEQIEAPANAFAFVAAMYLKQEAGAWATTAPTATTTESSVVTTVPATTTANVAETQQPIAAQPATAASTETGEASGTTVATATAGTATMIPVTVDTNPPPPRIVSHEGYVRSSISPVAPTPYELFDWDSGNVINYLYSPTPDLDLSRYKECRVIVTGEEGITARWAATPVLTIQKIFVTATGYPNVSKHVSSPRASEKNISGTQPLNRR